MNEIQALIEDYLRWLREGIVSTPLQDGWVEIVTPFLDRHNDSLQIYVRKEKDGFLLTDGDYIINDLLNSGCSLDTPKRQQLLNITLNGYGIQKDGNRLQVWANKENFAQKKHSLIQAMMAVNDLFVVAAQHITNLFLEDVENWLEKEEIRYSPKINFTGNSGYSHLFDFVIPKSKKMPERILQTISDPTKSQAESLLFKWLDVQKVRPSDSIIIPILNNVEKNVSKNILSAFQSYGIDPVLWTERDKALSILSV